MVPSSMAHTKFRCNHRQGTLLNRKKDSCVGLFVFFTQVALQRVCRAVDRTSSYTLPGTGNGHEAALEKSTAYACRPARCWSYVHKLMGHIPIRRARWGKPSLSGKCPAGCPCCQTRALHLLDGMAARLVQWLGELRTLMIG
jgi:hypothetical protein